MTIPPWWLSELDAAPTVPFVGIVVGLVDRSVPLLHSGIVYRDSGAAPARMLHLAFHAMVRDDALADATVQYHCSFLPIDEDRAVALAGFCRRVARRRARVPYGVVYQGGRVAEDGTVELSGQAVGLTCATYVLAVVESGLGEGGALLDLGTWRSRTDDGPWHDHIVKLLRERRVSNPDLISEEHIFTVAKEKGCARFRPEEVAAAAALPWPAPFAAVEPEGAAARTFLLSARSAPA